MGGGVSERFLSRVWGILSSWHRFKNSSCLNCMRRVGSLISPLTYMHCMAFWLGGHVDICYTAQEAMVIRSFLSFTSMLLRYLFYGLVFNGSFLTTFPGRELSSSSPNPLATTSSRMRRLPPLRRTRSMSPSTQQKPESSRSFSSRRRTP